MASGTKIADMTVGLHFDGNSMTMSMKNVQKKAESLSSNAGAASGKQFSGKWALAMGAISGIASTVFSKVASSISGAMDSAIGRMDTMNNFPKVMQSLGYSATEASDSVATMSDRLDGLPTALNDMVTNVQSLSATMGNLNKGTVNATTVGLAFNDMMLAGGQGTQAASNAFTQYNQMLAAGKVDQQAWNSLVSAAPGQMDQLSKSMLGSTANQKTLYNALKEGTVSFDELNAAMVKLDTEGGEGFASFNEQAIAGTEGLATNIENLQNSLTKVLTAAINGDDMTKPIVQFINRFDNLAKQLVPAVGRIAKAVANIVPAILHDLLKSIIGYLPTFAQGLAQMLPMLVNDLVDMGTDLVMQIAKSLPSIINPLVDGIISAILTLTDPENLALILDATLELFMAIAEALPDIIISLLDALPVLIENLVGFLTDPGTIKKLLGAFGRLFEKVIMRLPELLGKYAETVARNVGVLFSKIGELAAPLLETIGGWFGKIGDFFGMLAQKAGEFFVFIGQKVGEFFSWVWSIIWGKIEPIVSFIRNVATVLIAILATIGEFIWNNVLSPIIEKVSSCINTVVGATSSFVATAQEIIGTITGWVDANVVQPVTGFFTGLWNNIMQGVSVAVAFVKNIFSTVANWINANVVQPIKSFFISLWNGITQGVKAIKDTIKRVFETIGNIVKMPINAIIRGINRVIDKINSIKVPDWVPGIGGSHANFARIPELARGGLATSGTTAIIGEAGREAVLPLERNTDNWSGLLASALAAEFEDRDEGTGRPIQITNNVTLNNGLDMTEFNDKMIRQLRRAA